jgi:hypothetical protein
VFSLPKIVRNGIPSFIFFRKWIGTEFRVLFSSVNGSERNSKVFSSENGLERNSKVFSFEMVWNGIPRVFLFQEMVRNGIPRFFSSVKQVEFRGTPVCSVLFCIPRKKLLSENGNPNPLYCKEFHPLIVFSCSAVATNYGIML